MPTIQDVARQAGVGAATVSRVLSGNGYVKSETRERILQAIEELHYTPNEIARNLFYQKSGIVAVIVPELAHPFVAELVSAIEVALCGAGYQTMVCNTFYERNYEQRYLDMLKRRVVDGIIFAAHTSLDVAQYQNLHLPILGFDRILGPEIPCVSAGHVEGGRLAAEELLRGGCREVLQFIGAHHWESVSSELRPDGEPAEERRPSDGAKDWVVTPADQRHIVFQRTMEEHGVICHRVLEPSAFPLSAYVRPLAEETLRNYPGVDGIFGADLFAMACLQCALEQGRRVPEELKIVSYDGTAATRFMTPSLTTVCQPFQTLADEAVRIIIDLIQGKDAVEKRITVPVTLRRGRTTEAAPNP